MSQLFKDASKATTKIGHLDKKREEAVNRACAVHAAAVRVVLREAGHDVSKILVDHGIVHKAFAEHTESFQDAVIEEDAGPGEPTYPSVSDPQ